MIYRPVIPSGGYGGWRFLTRTIGAQKQAFAGSGSILRDLAYFREKIGSVRTADQLVSDRRLLSVALGAFGLEADINSRAFIRRVLTDGTIDPKALANRLADKRYLDLSKAFGFGDFTVARTQLSDFADQIAERYRTAEFEAAVGTQDGSLRLALNAQRELAVIAARPQSDDTRWYAVMGSAPLRKVIETAFGLPSTFAALDLDQQLAALRKRAGSVLGDGEVSQFADPDRTERLVRLFLLRGSAGASEASPSSLALSLLRSGRMSPAAVIGRR